MSVVCYVEANDPVTLDWIRRENIAGYGISQATRAAVDAFFAAARSGLYLSAFDRVNLLCGPSLNAALIPQLVGSGTAADTNLNFVSGDYAETGSSGGIKGNSSNKYLDTGVLQNAYSAINRHMSVYHTKIPTATFNYSIGVEDAANTDCWRISPGSPATTIGATSCHGTTSMVLTSQVDRSYHVLTNPATASQAFYLNGGSKQTAGASDCVNGTRSIYVMAINRAGSPVAQSNAVIGAYTLGASLSDAQVLNLSTAMAAFATAMGR